MEGIYTEDELHDVVDSGEHDDMIREQEIVVVFLGTNDIRGSKGKREKSGSKVFTDLLDACDRITFRLNTPTAIVQVPPQSSPAHDIEVAVLNTWLETVQTETPHVIHTPDIRKTPKDKTLQKRWLPPHRYSRKKDSWGHQHSHWGHNQTCRTQSTQEICHKKKRNQNRKPTNETQCYYNNWKQEGRRQ